MVIAIRKPKQLLFMWNKKTGLLFIILAFCNIPVFSQCLSSVNPVGGTANLLVLEKHSVRFISFYKHNTGNQYYHQNKPSDFDLINRAFYNYLGLIAAYGLTNKLTFETEAGYFINKTQKYNLSPSYTLRGYGFSNAVISAKYGLYTNNVKRLYYSVAVGAKLPFTTDPQIVDGVELPLEVQPTIGCYGLVIQSFFIKENSFKGLRFFITNRIEVNTANKQNYRPGTSVFTSFFLSKHLMSHWLPGDWTTIIQLRNEFRAKDKLCCGFKEASGGVLFFVSPQINYSIKEKWNVSFMFDYPVYQHFNGTQLGTKYGFTLSLSGILNAKSDNQ